MKTKYETITMVNGKKAESFSIITRKGSASGLFNDNKLWIHHIEGNGSVKGIMNILVNKFKTNEFVITPLINDNVENSIRGTIKICKHDSPDNPYGEDFKYLEGKWLR